MPNCGIHWKLHSVNQRWDADVAWPAFAIHIASVAMKSAQMLSRAIQRAVVALLDATIHDAMPPAIKIRIRMSRTIPSPQKDCDCKDRDSSHRQPRCIPAHASRLCETQNPIAKHGNLSQAANGNISRITPDLTCHPQERTNEQPVINPVEAPAGEP